MIVAIHQPNFFPWLGYFLKIYKSDKFVFLDNVQFPRTSRGNWINRVKINIGNEARWLTCPLIREGGVQKINEVEISESSDWKSKILKTVELNYRKTPHFIVVFELFQNLISCDTSKIAVLNEMAIRNVSEFLSLEVEFLRESTDLGEADSQLSGSALLADIVCRAGGGGYLAGDGAQGYEDVDEYRKRGLRFEKNNFISLPYSQGKTGFVGGLSILDAMFHLGADGTRKLLRECSAS